MPSRSWCVDIHQYIYNKKSQYSTFLNKYIPLDIFLYIQKYKLIGTYKIYGIDAGQKMSAEPMYQW